MQKWIICHVPEGTKSETTEPVLIYADGAIEALGVYVARVRSADCLHYLVEVDATSRAKSAPMAALSSDGVWGSCLATDPAQTLRVLGVKAAWVAA